MQEIDRQAIVECGIPGLQLMESAGRSCVEEIIAEFGSKMMLGEHYAWQA